MAHIAPELRLRRNGIFTIQYGAGDSDSIKAIFARQNSKLFDFNSFVPPAETPNLPELKPNVKYYDTLYLRGLNSMLKDEIAACCKRLRLSKNIAENYETIEADNQEEYLLKVLQNEVHYRDITRRNRLFKQAKFFYQKTFTDFSFDQIRIPSELTVEEIR